MRGGYYPTAMGSILRSGPTFITSAVLTAIKLIQGSKERLQSRKRRLSRALSRKHTTYKVKRTKV
jgi:hypothetical protein